MSDSSDEEDLSRFRDVVDTTFEFKGNTSSNEKEKPRSERYLDVATHYNDIKVSEEMQRRIGAKVSAVIDRNIEFVDIKRKCVKETEIEGGVKLFRDSKSFLTCEEVSDKDIVTEIHNKISKRIKSASKRRQIDLDVQEPNEKDKLNAAVVSGDFILLKEEKSWRPKRKQHIFEFVAIGKKKSDLNNGVRKPNTT
ncbi:uncharacterized protein LOC126775263 [Nymphalis io]|uniref:uncharacterized protein LOC126775263 n=1 Tax=Inachis io TaxID=171585 RepID=UPI00216978D9|nr:uncharacterized protein LOC126775263 [Nymphalis io]